MQNLGCERPSSLWEDEAGRAAGNPRGWERDDKLGRSLRERWEGAGLHPWGLGWWRRLAISAT